MSILKPLTKVVTTVLAMALFWNVRSLAAVEGTGSVAAVGVAAEPKTVSVGRMKTDGTLHYELTIVPQGALPFLLRPVLLSHVVELDPQGRPQSGWRLIGLHSQLAPEGRDLLRWRSLNGEEVDFVRATIQRAPTRAGQPSFWRIREARPGEHELYSLDGTAWVYAQGVPKRVTNPRFGAIEFLTQGALLKEALQKQAGGTGMSLFKATYDARARLDTLALAGGGESKFEWDADGLLRKWTHPDGVVWEFSYKDRLLSSVRQDDRITENIIWEENPGWNRPDSVWPAPVHLASDGRNEYAYRITNKGLELEMIERATGKTERGLFRPVHTRLWMKR